MSKKFDLNTYLNKYANNTTVKKTQGQFPDNFDINSSASRKNLSKNISSDNIRKIVSQRQLNPTNSYVGFHRSQIQCIERLESIKKSLMQEQNEMRYFIENHFKRLHDDMLRQHNRLRDQLLQMFEKSFQENERNIQQQIRISESNEPQQFVNIRNRINQIIQQIAQLQIGLKGQNYRASIANVVTFDFQGEISRIRMTLNEIQKKFRDDTVFFKFDEYKFNQLRQILSTMIKIEFIKGENSDDNFNKAFRKTVNGGSTKSVQNFDVPNIHKNRDLIRGSTHIKSGTLL